MRDFFKLIIIGSMLCVIASCGGKNSKWQPYTSNDGRFTVLMPEEPKKSEKTEITAFGKQVSHFITWKPATFSIDKFRLFQVGYTNCPARVVQDSALLSVMLDSCIKMRLADFTDKDIEIQTIELNGYPGRAFIFDGKGDQVIIVKECIVNDRKYDLTVIAKRNYATNNEINDFFDSFKVLK